MTALSKRLIAQIKATGPMTLADYMAACLLDPVDGYYTKRDPFGTDFITAPETSQMFGELVGLCLAQAWLDQGTPEKIVLAELGPGRGTLMADALRATKGVPGFHAALTVHFAEASPVLRSKQAKLVPEARFHDTVASLPERPLFLIANEFFDALPARQFVRKGTGWQERVVGLTDDKLSLGLTRPAPLLLLNDRLDDTKDGDLVEMMPSLPSIAAHIGVLIGTYGGAALVVDYGDWRSQGDTLQALQDNRSIDAFATPGEADLTTHVDFEAIALAVAPAKFTRLTPQGAFLERLGITSRAQTLAKRLTGAALNQHVAAHRRLTHPDEMGHLFKVLGIYPPTATPPPGLEP